MIKAILWDNDGILVDTEKLFYQATKETLATAGIDLKKDLFIEFSLVRGNGLKDYLLHAGVSGEDWESLRKVRNDRYSELLTESATLIDGVTETLETLFGNYTMGIVTSSRSDHFDIIHRSTGILHYFDFVLTSADYINTKPDPEPYLLGLKRTGVDKHECVVIEDSARGLTAANKAGIPCLMIPNEMSCIETYKGDFKLLNSVRDVPDTLDKMSRE